MGKRSWFSAMKKAMRASSKKEKRSPKSKSSPKNSLLVSLDACSSHTDPALANPLDQYHPITDMEFNLPENEEIKHVDSVTYTTIVEEDAEVKCTTSDSCFLGKTREEASAIKIQNAYRGYVARKAFRSLRAMSRLNLWIQGQAVKQQTTSTLMRIQTMSRVQSQVRTRKTRAAEVNQALQRQQKQQKRQKQAFDLSPRSKEQVDAMQRNRKQATERREKALAYAKVRQQEWRNSQKCVPAFEWNWSWSNRWDANRPWEPKSPVVKRQVSPSKPVSTGQRVNSTKNKSQQILKVVPTKRNNLVTKSLSTRGKMTTCAPMVVVR